jgi:type IV secretion system protein VirD4
MSSPGRRFRPRLFATGLAAACVGWRMASAGAVAGAVLCGVALAVAGLVLAAGLVWLRLRPRSGSNRAIGRWDRQSRRNHGTASWWHIVRTSSAWAMRRRAAVIRPSLRGESWWRRWRAPVRSIATPLCRAGLQKVWTSHEESTVRVGSPGTGKTAELACRVVDAPGGVVVTSTAADLYELTALLRRGRGPVWVFNPGGLGAVASTLRWQPLSGCTDPDTASRRATDLMGPPCESAEGERWDVHGRRVLAVLLHAAALGGYRMRDVGAWVAAPDKARAQVLAALVTSPRAAEMRRAAEHAIDTTPRTRDGVMLAIAPALAWVTRPAAAAAGDPDDGDGLFDVTDLTDRAGALYLLGDDDGTVAPLVGALVAEIAHQARALASVRPGGRLDPALMLALDEVTLVCPTPLDRWMADLRKRSIVVHAACQGLGQLRQRWGRDGASTILSSAAAVLLFGGCKDPDDLDLFMRLAGQREETTPTRDAGGRVTSTAPERVPVVPAAMLAGLPNHRALLVRRGMPVALVRTPVAWRRRDVRRAIAAEARAVRSVTEAADRIVADAARERTRPDTDPVSA